MLSFPYGGEISGVVLDALRAGALMAKKIASWASRV
jgi:hypothetical protein